MTFPLPAQPCFLESETRAGEGEKVKIFINGKQYETENTTLAEIKSRYYPESDLVIVNAGPASDLHKKVEEGDRLYFISKGSLPPEEELEALLYSRQPFGVTARLKKACVGIAGAGGLGTVVAEMLARAGIGKIVIADFDVVEPSNLNRQRFFLSQLGMTKVVALAENIKYFNPFVQVLPIKKKVTAANCGRIFAECCVVAECFDSPANKAELVFGLKKSLPDCFIVAVSGLAGIGCGNEIKARKISDRFYVVGDMLSEADERSGLLASRVGIAASMQAHTIIRLIAGEET